MRNMLWLLLATSLPWFYGCVLRGNVNYYAVHATTEGKVKIAAKDNGGNIEADKSSAASAAVSETGAATATPTATSTKGDKSNGSAKE